MHLLVRVDANAAIGSGHAVRCLALAEAWRRRGGTAQFLCADLNPRIERQITLRGFGVTRLRAPHPDPMDAIAVRGATEAVAGNGWIAVDGYRFTADYQRAVRRDGWRILAIDDYAHLACYEADVLLNQNVNAKQLVYRGRDGMRTLLGTTYVLLREEFIGAKEPCRAVPVRASRLLVTMGGGDPDNVTTRVVEAVTKLADAPVKIRVVVGPSNPHWEAIVEAAGPGIEVLRDPADVPATMRWADVAVTAAGSTCWELAYLGVPIITIVTAENQRGIAAGLAERGAAVNLGWHAAVADASISQTVDGVARDQAARRGLQEAAAALVDGAGADRVVTALTSASS